MERDYGKEIDELKGMIAELAQRNEEGVRIPPKSDMRRMTNNKHLPKQLRELCKQGGTGAVNYMGVFSSGGRQSNWIREKIDTDHLLALIESDVATKVLNCIGNNDRLNILLALLRGSKTVAQLVEYCGCNTTGQVYHHLKPLLAADVVAEDSNKRGYYLVLPHRVQGIIMVLAGISDLVDAKHGISEAWYSEDDAE
ncbi:MAG: winged helix-turn-helix domain-containing protein [Oscillospiraceae bacterium]|nr:winged helix-turn-helix domain-containing protein [Oscillospiraceae bacterium]